MPRKKKQVTGKTRLVVVADESGSMYPETRDVIDGFNEYIEEVRSNTQDVFVSLVKFNTRTNVVFENVPIGDVPRLDTARYSPGGGTALYDGVANAIKLGEQDLAENDKAILVIFTDGQENSSVENTREQVFKQITTKQNDGNWTVVFLGADQDAWDAGLSLGVAAGNSMMYNKVGGGHSHAMRGLAHATVTATASGGLHTNSFFADAGQSAADYLDAEDDDTKDSTPPAGTGG